MMLHTASRWGILKEFVINSQQAEGDLSYRDQINVLHF